MAIRPAFDPILDHIVSTLEEITAGEDYNYTPARVTRMKLSKGVPSVFPTYEVAFTDNRPSGGETHYGSATLYEANLGVLIIGWFRSADPWDTAARMEHDIIAAMERDPTRDGNALDSRWLGGEVIPSVEGSSGLSIVQVGYRIRYQFQAVAPEQKY